MVYKIRVILNCEEDVIRDIAIKKTVSLEDLHNAITNAFGFRGNEMASFYRSDDDWNQGEEFPLFDMSEGLNDIIQMKDITIDRALENKHDKLIYIYDFFTMWSFYVELIENDFDQSDFGLPSMVFSLGSIPKSKPDLKFESEDLSKGDFDDEEEDYDEFNFDEYMG